MTILEKRTLSNRLFATAAASVIATAMITPTASAVVPNDNTDSEEIVDDETNLTGVGMFFRADGFVCSGSLINPRTVLFAAHCVNDVPGEAFGTSIPAAWSFQADALPGFQDWFGSGFQSNPDLYVYNSNQVIWHPDSVNDAFGLGFIEADVAISSLDTPATGIPTWALLFSPLEAPDSVDSVNGTGYHVDITGYGGTGTGADGDIFGVDFRRRSAENMLGALASLDQRDNFLFGTGPETFPQVLYQTDFDDPNQSNPFDVNIFGDEALPNEGTTAGGDSGGPLILDAENNDLADEDLVLGVLSGGSRFFVDQNFSSYGTTSFYQPLFLYWDWIAAVNPYRYVGANAGDGDWEDGSHWTSLEDPNYRVIDANGNVVNGTPDAPGAGPDGDEPSFGLVCVEFGGPGDACQDLETDDLVPIGVTADAGGNSSGIGQVEGLESGRAQVSLDTVSGSAATDSENDSLETLLFEPEEEEQVGPFLEEELPEPTIENGLAGATDFVPNNVDPDPLAGVNARYFDVTLSADGTTRLSSTVEIDKLTLAGSGAGLDITSDGSLTSLIDVTQEAGTMNVDGTLSTPGDYLLVSGMLTGSGTVETPFLTNVMGGIAPGGMGTVGTLTIDGSAIMSSGSGLAIDINGGQSDLLAITGDASFGGTLALMVGNDGVEFGQSYTVVTYDGTASGEFDSVSEIAGVLEAVVSMGDGAVLVDIEAGSFLDVLPASTTAAQRSYASALDSARGTSYTNLQGLYQQIDTLEGADLANAFTAISPNDALTTGQGLFAFGNVLGTKFGSRLGEIRNGSTGFVRNVQGQPIQVASSDPNAGFSALASQATTMSSAASEPVQLKDGWGMFADVNFYEAESDSSRVGQDADYDGFLLTLGIDRDFGDGVVLGAMVTLNDSAGDNTEVIASSDHNGLTFGGYMSLPLWDYYYDAYVGLGFQTIDTQRRAFVNNALFRAEGETDATTVIAGIALGRDFALTNSMDLTPSVGLHYARYEIDGYTESGDDIALVVPDRELITAQFYAGAEASWKLGSKGQYRPSIGGKFIYDNEGDVDVINGTFAATPQAGTSVTVFGTEEIETWGEIEANFEFDISGVSTGSFGVRQTVGSDLSYTLLGADLKFRF
ncbi:MAG: autotransporter domain-containing protein [Henriciella sp.]|nr:autotransporter domain-containing protein [Henriciella sp.]